VVFKNGISSYLSKDSFAISDGSIQLVENNNVLMPVDWLNTKCHPATLANRSATIPLASPETTMASKTA
jgi:hypothetical protein